jgi:hypothetical protein
MEYNSQKYVDLLKYQESLRKQDKFLENEDRSKYLELLNYSVQVTEHFHWSHRTEYLQLMENFVRFKINGKDFYDKFCNMVEEIEKECRLLEQDFERLETIEPNPNSTDFAKWISEIYLCCDEFYPDFDPNNPPSFQFAKSEKDWRDIVTDMIPQIQKYF